MTDDEIMQQWDMWRKRIAEDNESLGSAPRDWFESILQHIEDRTRAEYEKPPELSDIQQSALY